MCLVVGLCGLSTHIYLSGKDDSWYTDVVFQYFRVCLLDDLSSLCFAPCAF